MEESERLSCNKYVAALSRVNQIMEVIREVKILSNSEDLPLTV